MAHSAFTISHVEQFHNPNEGRVIINANFDNLIDGIHELDIISATGSTTVLSGTNTSVDLIIFSGVPNYTVSVIDNPVFTSISATTISGSTLFSGTTDLSDLIISLIPPTVTPYGSQFTITATGTDSYTGTSMPSLTGYNSSSIYLTQFANSNTVTGVTLNIDGFGVLDLLKGTEDGLVPLDIGDISPSVTYYLTYDGTEFQFFTSSPVGTPTTYTNLSPTTVAVGGVPAGTTFSGATWQGIFDTLFYPSLTSTFTAFSLRTTASSGSSIQNTVLEVGNSVSGGSKAFTWTTSNPAFVQPNTIKIYSGASINLSSPSSGMTNNSFKALTLTNTRRTSPGSWFWKIVATRTTSSTFTTSFTVNWYWKRMYGVSTATTITTSSGVNTFGALSALTTTLAGTYAFVGAGYKYFFAPTTFANPTLFKDSSTNLSIAMADSSDDSFFSGVSSGYYYGTTSVTNQYGIAQNYRIYRTKNFLFGDISITVT